VGVLATLIEQHDAATAALAEFDAPFKADETREATEPEAIERATLDETVVRLEERIAEVNEGELRAARVNEARKRVSTPAHITSEARTYGPENPDNSYFADMCRASWPGDPMYQEAVMRMAQHGKEVIRDAEDDPEYRKIVISKAKEHYRRDGMRSRQVVADLKSRRGEIRAMDTTSASGGSFVTPQYLVSDWAAYRQFGRNYIDLTNKSPLPDYGMTVYLPTVQSASAVSAQVGQNQGVAETDPTAGYLSSNLVTEAGQVVISQQLLDRAGPGIQFDQITFDSLQRNYAQTIDAAVIVAAIANAGTVTNSAAGATGQNVFQSFLSDIAAATAQMETTQGTVLSPTHAHVTGTEFAFLSTQLDAYGRPYIANVQANAAVYSNSDMSFSSPPEGDTGFAVGGLPIIKDSNIPVTGSNTRLVVSHMPEVWVWEGDLVPRTIPQTFAQNLSILLQVYTYYTVIVRYPKAVQVISGNRYPAAPTYTQT